MSSSSAFFSTEEDDSQQDSGNFLFKYYFAFYITPFLARCAIQNLSLTFCRAAL